MSRWFDKKQRSEIAGLSAAAAVATTGLAVLYASGPEPRTSASLVAATATAGFLALAVYFVSATLPRPVATILIGYAIGLGLLLVVGSLVFLLRGRTEWTSWAALALGLVIVASGVPALRAVAGATPPRRGNRSMTGTALGSIEIAIGVVTLLVAVFIVFSLVGEHDPHGFARLGIFLFGSLGVAMIGAGWALRELVKGRWLLQLALIAYSAWCLLKLLG